MFIIVKGEMIRLCISKNVKLDRCGLEFNSWSGKSLISVIRDWLDAKLESQSGNKIRIKDTIEYYWEYSNLE